LYLRVLFFRGVLECGLVRRLMYRWKMLASAKQKYATSLTYVLRARCRGHRRNYSDKEQKIYLQTEGEGEAEALLQVASRPVL
jgi:hypothetical protein